MFLQSLFQELGNKKIVQLTLELHDSICMWIFSIDILGNYLEICDNLKKFSSFLYFRNIVYVTYKVSVNGQFILSVRLPVDSRLLVIKFFGGVKGIDGFSTAPLSPHCSMISCIKK